MRLLFVAGAAIPALVSLTVIVAGQYAPTDGSEAPASGASVVAEGGAQTATCAGSEDCESDLAGRDQELLPPDAPLASNLQPGDLLDQLIGQTGGVEAPGFQDGQTPDLSCSTPLSCSEGLPLPTMAWTATGVDPVDGGQTGEALVLFGHGVRDAGDGWSPAARGLNASDAGGVAAAGGGSAAGGFLAASNDQPPAVSGAETPSGNNGSGSSIAGAFLNASNGAGPEDGGSKLSTSNSGFASGGSRSSVEPDADPAVKSFVEELLLGDGNHGGTDGGDGPREGPAILALGSSGQPPSEHEGEPEGGQPDGPAFGDVLEQFSGGDEGEDYSDLAGGPADGHHPDLTPSEVPEPANIVMVATGLLIAVGHLRRRRRT